MRIRQILSLGAVCVLSVGLLQGQGISEDEIRIVNQQYVPEVAGVIRVQTNLVDIGVVVRDSNGHPIAGLKQEDFQVFDQGKPQAITHFVVESAPPPVVEAAPGAPKAAEAAPLPAFVPPRYVGFYFDDENMATSDLTFARQAAEGYIRKNMESTALGGIFTSSTTVTQSFTDDKKKLIDTLGQLRSHQRSATFGAMSCPRITPYQAYQIVEFFNSHSDAFDLAMAQAQTCNCGDPASCARLVETQAATVLSLSEQYAQESLGTLGDVLHYMEKMPGRRTLVMASSGFFGETNKVQKAREKMIDTALHSGVVINTLDAKGLAADWLGGNPADGPPIIVGPAQMGYADELASDERSYANDSMALLAEGTGGKFFHNSNDLEGGLREIASVAEVSYVLGFSPDAEKSDGAYHTLKVRLPGKSDVSIAARPGYFAPAKPKAAPILKLQKLNKEVMASDNLTELPIELSTQSGRLGSGEPALRVSVHVDVSKFPFKKENGRHVDRLIFITALLDNKGTFLAGVQEIMDMTMKDATLAKAKRDGFDAKFSLQAPTGTYKLREVVQEVVGGRLATISQAVEIR